MFVEDLIRGGENESLEFKEWSGEDDKGYLKTVVAFSNCIGGTIIFGVSDSGEVLGLEGTVEKIRDSLIDSIYASIFPHIFPNVFVYTLDGKDLIILEVPISNQRPVSLREGGVSKVFVRIGASTRLADEGSLASIEVDASPRSQDSVIDRSSSIREEQIECLCARLTKRKGDRVTVSDLVSLGLLVPEGEGYLPTMAFDLLTVNRYPNAFIQCARLIGPNETEFSDRTEYRGSILTQVDRGLEFVLSMINKPSRIDGIVRIDGFEIPVTAIREVILNAVIHRGYRTDPGPITIGVYDDRVEVTSPGGLPYGQTYEGMMLGLSLPRNRLIAAVFKECKLSEGWGRGIRRVIEACQKEGLREPSIEVIGHSVRVTVYREGRDNRTMTSSAADERAVIRYFRDNPTGTIAMLCQDVPMTKHDAEVAIRALKEKGILRRIGARKRGEWIIETDRFEEWYE